LAIAPHDTTLYYFFIFYFHCQAHPHMLTSLRGYGVATVNHQ